MWWSDPRCSPARAATEHRASAGPDELDEYQHAACRTTGRVTHAACRVWHLCRSQAAL
jgi:hypothetical protein